MGAQWKAKGKELAANARGRIFGKLSKDIMLAARSGQIINTASFAGLAGAPGMMTYGVAKAAVVALSEQLRAETHHHGVRVSVICPAFFRTNLLETAFASDKVKAKVIKLMDTSPDTLDGVAD